MIRSHLDGGDLEDITRSLGELADSKPHLFLAEVKRRSMPTRELRAIVRMLPEAVVDDAGARRAAVSARVKSLSSVADDNLRNVRDTSISLLTGDGAR
jgi:hypothetical protein